MDFFPPEFSNVPDSPSEMILSLLREWQTKISKDLIRIQVKGTTVSPPPPYSILNSSSRGHFSIKIIMA